MAKKKKKKKLRLLILGGLVAAAILLGWCGRGWLGGGDSGDERKKADEAKVRPAVAVAVDAGSAPRCRLRVDKAGVHLNGAVSSVEAVVAACKAVGEAELLVTGEAKYGSVEELKDALEKAGVRIFTAGAKPR
jgi:hypothetical protein